MRNTRFIIVSCLALFAFVALVTSSARGQQSKSVFHQELSWSPDGSRISFSSNDSGTFNVYVMLADGRNPIKLTRTGANLWTTWSPDSKRIAFASKRGNDTDIYVMDADGSNETQLTRNAGRNATPSWSPDGKHIAFRSDRDGHRQIYLMDADGSHQTRVTSDDANDDNPAFSPDGSEIVFYSDVAGQGKDQVYVINADGTSPRRVTDGAANNIYPSWLPDGKHIAFSSNRDGEGNGLYVADVDGSNLKRVNDVKTFFARWAPNRSRIAYISGDFEHGTEISVMNPDGSGKQPIHSTAPQIATPALSQDKPQPVYFFNPDWSPDGSKIAFESTRNGKEAVYTIQVDGSGLRQLTSGESNPSGQPRWSSDGRQIVFISSREGREGLFLMNADGSQQRRLTNTTIGGDFVPVLSPKGDQVAFVSSEDEKTRTTDIYVIRTDGTGRTRLTNCDESVCGGAEWSPDGEKILFSKELAVPKKFPSLSSEERTEVKARVRNSGEIFIMDKDGSHVRNLTNNNLRNGHARWSKDGKTIYFLSQREGAPNVYAMNADGSNVRKVADGSIVSDPNISRDGKYLVYTKKVNEKDGLYLYELKTGKEQLLIGGSGQPATATPATLPLVFGGDPRVSPDGSRILFRSNRTGVSQLYVMNADGSNTQQITTGSSGAYSPNWSPDGKQIVYVTSGAAQVDQIVIVNADGAQRHVVSEAKGNQSPSWSPDGSKILFAAGDFPVINIYTMNADGSERRNIAPNEGFDYDPVWSPDGKTTALVTGIRGQGVRVWVMNPDGSGRRRITGSGDNEERPAWSPDGRYLALQASKRGGGPHEAYIHVVEVSGGVDRRLGTHDHPHLDETPSWFPDGKRIAFQSDRTGRMEVWVMNSDGTEPRQVTSAR